MKIKELSHYGGGCRRRLGFIWSDLAEKEASYFDATITAKGWNPLFVGPPSWLHFHEFSRWHLICPQWKLNMQKWALNDTSQKQPPQLDIVSKLQKICDNGSDFFNEYFSSDIEMLTI